MNQYFKSQSLSRYGNRTLVLKSIVMLSLFVIPFVFINTGLIGNPFLLLFMYLLSGIGMIGVGMGIMHDAIHGSYSKNQKVNKYLGYTMNLIGANNTVWRIQHNVLHHTYTNIDHADEDINAPFFLRFSPNAKRYWLHRFQHYSIWFFYGLTTLSWVTLKDFVQLRKYYHQGLISDRGVYRSEMLKLIAWKLFYYSYALVVPILMAPFSAWFVVLAFLAMHFLAGLAVSFVFQTAHVMPGSEFPIPDQNGMIANNWTIHQLATTCNFSPRSRIFSWFVGGLNYQVEHHLLPHVSHVHYKNLSLIVAGTAREYGLPYHTKSTFIAAVADHLKMLRQLGKMETERPASASLT